MGMGLQVEVVDREKNALVFREIFHDFPILIGRDVVANVSLDAYPIVSKFHCKLELRSDGSVMLIDSGSRNGTAIGSPTATIPPRESIDLRKHGMAFMIGPLHFNVETIEAPRAPETRDRGGVMLSSNPVRLPQTARVEGAEAIAMSVEARDIADELRAPYEAYRTAWNSFYARFAERLQPLQPETRKQVLQLLATRFPAIFAEPDFQRLAKHFAIPVAELRTPGAAREEDAALQVLRELATWYGTRPLEDTNAIILFAKKIQDALDVFALAYVRLRDGLRSSEGQFEVDRGRRSNAAASPPIEVARSPRDVAGLLLDWTNPADATRFIRSLVADRAIHEMGFINGVAKGAEALVAHHSPAAVVEDFQAARKAGRIPFSLGGYYKKLWTFFEARHKEREAKETWAILFGRDFAQAYKQVSADAVSVDDSKPSNRRQNAAMPVVESETIPRPGVVEKTPENHGLPRPMNGPTGTLVVPRGIVPQPNTGPMIDKTPSPHRRS